MLTSKQRAYLRGLANGIDTVLYIGKGEIGENIIAQARDALKARELIKGKVLDNSSDSARSAAEKLSSATESETVCVIGSKFVLFKKNPDKPVIKLPRARTK